MFPSWLWKQKSYLEAESSWGNMVQKVQLDYILLLKCLWSELFEAERSYTDIPKPEIQLFTVFCFFFFKVLICHEIAVEWDIQ